MMATTDTKMVAMMKRCTRWNTGECSSRKASWKCSLSDRVDAAVAVDIGFLLAAAVRGRVTSLRMGVSSVGEHTSARHGPQGGARRGSGLTLPAVHRIIAALRHCDPDGTPAAASHEMT